MAVEGRVVTVTTAATALNLATDAGGPAGKGICVQNKSGSSVYLGGSDVDTTANYGYLLGDGEVVAFDLEAGEIMYAIVASSTKAVNVMRTGL